MVEMSAVWLRAGGGQGGRGGEAAAEGAEVAEAEQHGPLHHVPGGCRRRHARCVHPQDLIAPLRGFALIQV